MDTRRFAKIDNSTSCGARSCRVTSTRAYIQSRAYRQKRPAAFCAGPLANTKLLFLYCGAKMFTAFARGRYAYQRARTRRAERRDKRTGLNILLQHAYGNREFSYSQNTELGSSHLRIYIHRLRYVYIRDFLVRYGAIVSVYPCIEPVRDRRTGIVSSKIALASTPLLSILFTFRSVCS